LARVPGAAGGRGERLAGAFLRGEAMVPGHGHGMEVPARDGDNRGRRGGQLAASEAPMAGPAAVKDARKVPCQELHGCSRRATKGLCKMPCSRPCRRINALETGRSTAACTWAGHMLRAPTGITDPGRFHGTEGWNEVAV